MLSELLRQHTGSQAAVVTPARTTSWAQLQPLVTRAREQFDALRGARVAVVCDPFAETLAALAALDALDAEVVLIDRDLLPRAQTLDVGATIEPGADTGPRISILAPVGATHPRTVVTLTSGTTGQPKQVRHTWHSLAAYARLQDTTPHRWASGYRLRLFASWQVLMQAWAAGGTFVMSGTQSATDTAAFWTRAAADSASATPSFWRWLVMSADPAQLAAMPLRQVTMGGEPVDQATLDRLRERLPAARLTHIYATTELGRCFAVSDGRAGFPAAWLGATTSSGRELQVADGELVVRVAGSSAWHRTGDLVQIDGDRVRFTGRQDDLLNVGGEKVSPLAVEQALRQVPGVADVRVYGRRSAIVGQLVACEIVAAAGAQADAVRDAVGAAAQRLRPAERPRLIDFVDAVTLSPAGKATHHDGSA